MSDEQKVLQLEIPLGEGTERKLKSLAMLSPEAAQDIEQRLREHLQSELSEYVDRTVTAAIFKHMGELDGKEYGDLGERPAPAAAPVEEEVVEEKVEEAAEAATDHGLSDDEDSQDNKSAEEQAEELAAKLARNEPVDVPGLPVATAPDIAAPQVTFEDVDEDPEAFLDVALGAKPVKKAPVQPSVPIQAPNKPMEREAEDMFDPRRRQASISAYGGG